LKWSGGKLRDTGLVLMAEDIIAIVASTALWSVVRDATVVEDATTGKETGGR